MLPEFNLQNGKIIVDYGKKREYKRYLIVKGNEFEIYNTGHNSFRMTRHPKFYDDLANMLDLFVDESMNKVHNDDWTVSRRSDGYADITGHFVSISTYPVSVRFSFSIRQRYIKDLVRYIRRGSGV